MTMSHRFSKGLLMVLLANMFLFGSLATAGGRTWAPDPCEGCCEEDAPYETCNLFKPGCHALACVPVEMSEDYCVAHCFYDYPCDYFTYGCIVVEQGN